MRTPLVSIASARVANKLLRESRLKVRTFLALFRLQRGPRAHSYMERYSLQPHIKVTILGQFVNGQVA